MILLFSVPEPNSLFLNAGITSSCVTLFPVLVSLISFLYLHHQYRARDSFRRFFCFSAFRNVSFGLPSKRIQYLLLLGSCIFSSLEMRG